MKQKSIADRLFNGVNISLLLVISAVMLFPFVYLFSVSFSSFEDFLGNKLLLWPSSGRPTPMNIFGPPERSGRRC